MRRAVVATSNTATGSPCDLQVMRREGPRRTDRKNCNQMTCDVRNRDKLDRYRLQRISLFLCLIWTLQSVFGSLYQTECHFLGICTSLGHFIKFFKSRSRMMYIGWPILYIWMTITAALSKLVNTLHANRFLIRWWHFWAAKNWNPTFCQRTFQIIPCIQIESWKLYNVSMEDQNMCDYTIGAL